VIFLEGLLVAAIAAYILGTDIVSLLRRMAEEADGALDGLFHAVELGEGRIDLDGAVLEDARQAESLKS